MKKLTKIFSLAIAAVMTTAATASAMTFNEPMSYQFPLEAYSKNQRFYSGDGHSCYPQIESFYGTKYYDNGYTTPAESEEGESVKTIDSFDGATKYMHIGNSSSNPDYSVMNVMFDHGDVATSTRFVGSFGKTRSEVTFRLSEYTGDGTESYMLGFYQNVIKADGTAATIGIKAYYPFYDENKAIKGYMLRTVYDEQYVGEILFGKWYRMIVDIDVQNSKMEYILEQYKDDKSGQIEKTVKKECNIPDLKCVANMYYRWNAKIYSVDIANLKMTRDALDIKDLTVDGTAQNTITAHVQVASNAPANDYTHNYTYIDSNGIEKWVTNKLSTLWSYDGDTGIERCVSKETSPTLILAQYDKDGTLLNVESKTLDSLPTLSWGRTANQNTRADASVADFEYKNIDITFNKESGYSYAKAYVWNNMDELVPYTECKSTVTVAEE